VQLAVELTRRLEERLELVRREYVRVVPLDRFPRPPTAGYVPLDPSGILRVVEDGSEREQRLVDRAVGDRAQPAAAAIADRLSGLKRGANQRILLVNVAPVPFDRVAPWKLRQASRWESGPGKRRSAR
jgi:hypothetical protein